MDAVEFILNKARYCKDRNCGMCEIYDECDVTLDCITKEQAKRMVDFVEQWSKEHPVKTRQSEFLKMFPNAPLDDNGVVVVDPCDVDKMLCNAFENDKCSMNCSVCRHAYWVEKVE